MTHLVAFLGVALLVIATPGQDTALTIRMPLAGGGIHSLVDAVRGAGSARDRAPRVRPAAAYRRGRLSNLGNPKLALLWLSLCAGVVARLGDILRRSRISGTLDALTGSVLIAFGARMATER